MSLKVDYQTPPDPASDRSLRILRRMILVCAILPMTLGVLDLVLLAVTDLELFAWMGLVLLVVGGLLVLAGAGLLIAWFVRSAMLSRGRGGTWGFGVMAAGLLLGNCVAAVGCLWFGMLLVTASRVSIGIENLTGAPIDVVRVEAGLSPEEKRGLGHDGTFWFNYRRSRVRGVLIRLEQGGKQVEVRPEVPAATTTQRNATIYYRVLPGLEAVDYRDPRYLDKPLLPAKGMARTSIPATTAPHP